MKKLILSAVLGSFIFASPAAQAQSSNADYVRLSFYLTLVATCGHITKQIAPRGARATLPRHIATISMGMLTLMFTRLLFNDQLDSTATDLKNSIPDLLRPKKQNCPALLEDCKTSLEDCKKIITPIEAADQINRINQLKEEKAVLLLKESFLRIQPFLGYWGKNPAEVTKILKNLSENFLKLYPGYTDQEGDNFVSLPKSSPAHTGESDMYDSELIEKTAKSCGFQTAQFDTATIDSLKQLLVFLVENNLKPKALYIHRFLGLLGIQIPMNQSFTEPDTGSKSSDL
ncbi:MAG: hypothetical protein WCK42_00255 [Myxococcaceae bacterium]